MSTLIMMNLNNISQNVDVPGSGDAATSIVVDKCGKKEGGRNTCRTLMQAAELNSGEVGVVKQETTGTRKFLMK